MTAEMLSYPNTLLMACPIGDGAAAAIVVSDAKLRTLDPDVRRRAVKIAASVLTTDPYTPTTEILPDVNTLTRNAADRAYEVAGVGPEDLDLVELHDCFATAELVHYDNLRLCEPGGAGDVHRLGSAVARRPDAGQRLGRPAVEGPPDRRHRHRQCLRGRDPAARRGRRPAAARPEGRAHARHRTRLGLLSAHPRARHEVTLLAGVRVLDLGIWRPVPYATQLLVEMGADVIKVEPPGGDPMRVFPDLFAILNAGKRAAAVDLKDAEGRAAVLALARDADVVIEGFRPGVVDRLGVGYDDVRA